MGFYDRFEVLFTSIAQMRKYDADDSRATKDKTVREWERFYVYWTEGDDFIKFIIVKSHKL